MYFLLVSVLMMVIQAGTPPDPAALEGLVVDRATAATVFSARVELRNPSGGGSLEYATTTDENGRFTFSKIRPGQYRLIAARAGYIQAEYGDNVPANVTLGPGQRMPGVRLSIRQGGIISGRITDRARPLALANVFALKSSYTEGRRVLTVVASAQTNDLGEYSIFWLPPAHYYVCTTVVAPGSRAAADSAEIIVNPGGSDNASLLAERLSLRPVFKKPLASGLKDDEEYRTTCFPGTADPGGISVISGSDLTNIDLDLKPVKPVKITGTVAGLPNTGGSPPRLNVALLAFESTLLAGTPAAAANNQQAAPLDANGSFSFPKVVPGRYVLQATLGNRMARQVIEVFAADLNVSLAMTEGLDIAGRVTLDSGQTIVPEIAKVSVLLRTEPALPPLYSGAVNPDGSFEIKGVSPGEYRVFVDPILPPKGAASAARPPASLQGVYVTSIRFGQRDVLNDGLQIQSRVDGQLEITLGQTAGALEGRVVNASGQPVRGATVVVMTTSALRYRVNQQFTITDGSGQFLLRDIPPGDYQLYAWEDIDKGDWQDPGFMRNLEREGLAVKLTNGMTQRVELRTIPIVR